MTEKSREQKLRRAARRKGLIATKGRREFYDNFHGWMIIDERTDFVTAGAFPSAYSLTLEEAEAYIYD